jgi:NAD(P)H-dependent FMN reductase
MKIAIILGSTRPKYRLGERVAKWVMSETQKYSQAEFAFLDLREYNLPFFNEAEGPRGNKNRQPEENVKKWLEDIASADGYIFITPEYNEGPSAALKNAIDFLAFEAKRKPAVIIGYSDGSNGGMYAPIQLRVNLGEVGIVALKAQQIILNADKIINEDGVVLATEKEALERRFARIFDELFWFTDALKVAREKQKD